MDYTFSLHSKYLACGGMSTCKLPLSTSREACCVPSIGSPSIWREKGVPDSMEAFRNGMQRAWSEVSVMPGQHVEDDAESIRQGGAGKQP